MSASGHRSAWPPSAHPSTIPLSVLDQSEEAQTRAEQSLRRVEKQIAALETAFLAESGPQNIFTDSKASRQWLKRAASGKGEETAPGPRDKSSIRAEERLFTRYSTSSERWLGKGRKGRKSDAEALGVGSKRGRKPGSGDLKQDKGKRKKGRKGKVAVETSGASVRIGAAGVDGKDMEGEGKALQHAAAAVAKKLLQGEGKREGVEVVKPLKEKKGKKK